ncbi:MAG: hypothetical protein AABM66_15100, partial [Actinomycetota bacterium]
AVGSSEIAADAVTTAEILANTVAIGDIAQSVWSGSAHQEGTLAARPAAAASNNGFLYFATDDNGGTLYRSNGSSWTKVAASATSSWQKLGEASLSTAASDVTVSGLPPRKHLQIRIRIAGYSSSGIARLRFNGDTGTNYSDKRQDDAAAVVSSTSTNGIRVAAAGTSAARGIIVFDVINEATRAKSAIGQGHSTSEVATIAPILNRSAGVWANTTSQIDSVTLNVGTGGGNLLAGTEVTVFGSN